MAFTDPTYFVARFKEVYRRFRPGMDALTARIEAYNHTVQHWPLCMKSIPIVQMQIAEWVQNQEQGVDT